MEKMDVFALVDELQEEIEMSPTKGFSKSKLVDQKIVMEIIEDIKAALHDELDFAKKVASERDQILKSADIQAEEIVRRAKKEAEAMIKQEEITQAAYEKANKLIENSRAKAGEIKKMANTYAEEVLDELETFYRESIDLVGENKARLYAKMNSDQKAPTSEN
ncbi:MAG: hypothetical protein KH334_05635 [Clostridiales bacterium]|nr:hypothetical protein [Clostridiales bacterium]